MPTPKLKKSPQIQSMTRRTGIVFTNDDQMRTFAETPDMRFESGSVNTAMESTSFKEICEKAEKNKSEYIVFFHDHFFGGGERTLHLAHPDFIKYTKKMSEYAEKYGMGIGASVTNPLDLGRNFKDVVGVGGQHRFFAEGILNEDGSFKFNGVLCSRWCNNKGFTYPQFDRARLFAYTEIDDGSEYLVIPPDSIREIPKDDYTCTVSEEPYEMTGHVDNRHMIVEGRTALHGNRVFAVFYMNTAEMDYFHPKVTEYVHDIIDMYRKEGVEFMELYSDEMHIQFDWDFNHFGPYEIPTRYMTENFQNELAKKDEIFSDFDVALIYMCYDMMADRNMYGRSHTQHVLGKSKSELYRTFLLRRTYFEMLQDKVVGICCEARDYIRSSYVKNKGWDPQCLGHATWQESPTCDQYGEGGLGSMFWKGVRKGICTYDYTPDYVYSSTIRECISGCYDYFKWNDYFSYGGTDFCECGWFDRNYYGGAMSASLGTLNRNRTASWGAWGFPKQARKRFVAVSVGFGTYRTVKETAVTFGEPRAIDVLYIYPKDLTAIEERFGSWMVQYGYCNYVPRDRFVNLGKVENGKIKLGMADYSTVVVGFEPFYDERFVAMLEKFVKQGGNVVWNSTPPADENGKIPSRWLKLFGLKSADSLLDGGQAHSVSFVGSLSGIEKMNVPTDMLPDRIYSVVPSEQSEAIAVAHNSVIGVKRVLGDGKAVYIGCRLRDDQSGDTGDAPSTLFDVLKKLGAYGGENSFDNTETISRKTEYFATKFANGTYSLCRHYYPMKELWTGEYGRNDEKDDEFLSTYPYMVPTELDLDGFSIEGHKISYKGDGTVQYRLDRSGKLIGFRGEKSCGITVDGREYRITPESADTIFGRIEDDRLPDGYKKGWIVISNSPIVDLCCRISKDAELYVDENGDGTHLSEDSRLSLKGSVLHKSDIPAVIILSK